MKGERAFVYSVVEERVSIRRAIKVPARTVSSRGSAKGNARVEEMGVAEDRRSPREVGVACDDVHHRARVKET